jgi:hypothetical protein
MDIGKMIETGKNVFKLLTGKSEEGYIPQKTPVVGSHAMPAAPTAQDPALPRADVDLSPHFGLFELTKTNNAALQSKNRFLTDAQLKKARELAALMEQIRTIMGCAIDVHSGYRCPDLNAATAKAATKSQHMLFEACDWSPAGPDTVESIEAAFQKVLAAAKRGEIKFGQLIVEQANRGYSKSIWIHVSLGRPYRDPARCGEVLRMVEKDGEQVYTLIERLA